MSKNKSSQERPESIVHRIPGFSNQFKKDLAWWFKTDFKKASKVLDMVTAVMQDPFQGLAKPEPLKYVDADTWSRRIDSEHRLVYRVGSNQIDFLSCRFHYSNTK